MRGFHSTAFAHPYYARFSRHSRAQISAKHLHNERNFPQAKLDSEINAHFLLNKRGNLYFSLLNNSAHDILFNLKIFIKDYWKEKSIGESVHITYSGMQIMTVTLQTPYGHVV